MPATAKHVLRTWRNGENSAVDLGTVIAAGVTGVVGVAGIGGTLLSARMTSKSDADNLRTSIAAEDTRAKPAETDSRRDQMTR